MPDDPENLLTETGGSPPQGPPLQSPIPPLAPREIWNLHDLLMFVAFIPFALLVSGFVVLIGYVVLRPFAGWQVKVDLVKSDTIFLLIQQCAFYLFILIFLFLLAKLQHQQPFWKSLGWKRPTARQVAGYLGGGCGLAIATGLGLWLLPDTQAFPLEKLFDSPTSSLAIGAFAISIAPVIEEVVFRGLLFAVFERAVGWRFAVVTTAVLFAGLHVPEYWQAWHHLFMILVVGMVFSLARGRTGNLAPSIILHVGYNSLIITSLYFSTGHFRTAMGLWRR
jgi:hypothetical protein